MHSVHQAPAHSAKQSPCGTDHPSAKASAFRSLNPQRMGGTLLGLLVTLVMVGPARLATAADESIDFTAFSEGPISQYVGVDSIVSFSLSGEGAAGVPYVFNYGDGNHIANSPTGDYPTNTILEVSFNTAVTNVIFGFNAYGLNGHPDQGWSAYDPLGSLLHESPFYSSYGIEIFDLSKFGEIGRLEFNNGENNWNMGLFSLAWTTGPNYADALTSANTTGVAMGNYNSSAVNNITSTVLGGLHNGRIVRARSQLNNPRLMDTQSWVAADRSLSNYLHFAGNQGITVRQALGLEDVPVASTVPGGSAPIMMGMAITSPKAPLDAKVPYEEPKRWELYTVGDIGDVDQDALDTVNRGFRNRTYAGSVGAEYFVSEKLNVGTAFSYADSDTDFSENLGSADIDGQLGSVYATYFKNSAYVDALYSYGEFDHDLIRSTLGGDSFGNTESSVHTFSVNAGQNFDYKGLVTGPTVGLDHSRGTIDAYTETGGLPLNFADRDFESTISSLGWQVSKTQMVNDNVLMLQASASWDHEYQPGSGVTSGSLVADPAVPFNGVNAGPGDNWLNVGLGLRLITRQGWDFEVDYQTQLLRDDVTAHFAGLKTSVRF